MEQLLQPAAPAAAELAPQRIRLHASGGEYFRIWIVNLLLTIVTLGVYSAWAKVRRNQYFYSCTELAGASFEYHGKPLAILKGRMLALLLIGGYNLALHLAPVAALVMLVVMGAVMPWLIWNSLKFRLYYTSYRGIRFGFRGTLKDAYFHFLLLPVVYVLSFTLALPFVHQRIKRFQHSESRYGSQHFNFDASVGAFYQRYAVLVLLIVGGGVVAALAGAGTSMLASPASGLLMIVVLYAYMALLVPLFLTLIQNLIWNHTGIGAHRLRSELKWGRTAFILVTNVLGIAFTLGLFTPFAVVRWQRYRLESISLLPAGSLDEFVAGAQDDVGATGEGASDLLDIDLSI